MDPSWEFQAPQFVDFAGLGAAGPPAEDGADTFFDVDMESGERLGGEVEVGGVSELVVSDTPTTGVMEVAPAAVEVEEAKEVVEEGKPARKGPSNMVTSWGKGAVKAVGGSKGEGAKAARPETPTRKALRAKVSATIDNIRNSPKMPFRRTPKRLGTNQQSPRLQPPAARRRSVSASGGEVQRSLGRATAALPKTPEVMKKYRQKMAAMEVSSRLTQPTSSSLMKVQPPLKQGLAVRPPASKPTLTLPKEFSFATGRKTAVKPPTGADAPDFSRMLRSYSKEARTQDSTARPTQPVPFPRQERSRRHSADPNAPEAQYKSQAEQILRYQNSTPDRFRSRPQSREKTPKLRNRSASPAARLTIPHTPALATRGRGRTTTALSQEEREAMEHASHQAQQFKAQGVGEALPRYKYGQVEKKACTIPEPFSLHGSMARPVVRMEEEQQHVFTAKPVNKRVMAAPVGVPEKRANILIEPQSPAFSLKSRMAERNLAKAAVVEVVEEPIARARPAPHRGVPVSLPAAAKKSTQPEPFSFEQRDQSTLARREDRMRRVVEQERVARQFHANPVPRAVETGGRLPERQPIALTKPEPFRMAIDERVDARVAKWQEGLKEELEEQRRATNFKAQEARSLVIPPFVPKPSDKPLSEISNFTLHSDRRAEERAVYELERSAKEAGLEGQRRELEERRRRQEEEEVQKQRRAAVHRAQPVKQYKPLEVKPSTKPLTMPESPHLQAGKASKAKTNSTFSQ